MGYSKYPYGNIQTIHPVIGLCKCVYEICCGATAAAMQISFKLSPCRPCGCNLMMWHCGRLRPVLEIVLSSVCGLPLCNYLFSHRHCWIAGPLKATGSANSEPAAALSVSGRSLKPTTGCEVLENSAGSVHEKITRVSVSHVEDTFYN